MSTDLDRLTYGVYGYARNRMNEADGYYGADYEYIDEADDYINFDSNSGTLAVKGMNRKLLGDGEGFYHTDIPSYNRASGANGVGNPTRTSKGTAPVASMNRKLVGPGESFYSEGKLFDGLYDAFNPPKNNFEKAARFIKRNPKKSLAIGAALAGAGLLANKVRKIRQARNNPTFDPSSRVY